MSSFCADILWPKKLQSQTVIREKAAQSSFMQKRLKKNVNEIDTRFDRSLKKSRNKKV